MKKYRFLATACLASTLAACSGLPQQPSEPVARQPQPEATAALDDPQVPPAEAVQPPAEPGMELSQELLYQLLVAEFAGQRGAMALSADAYLDAARATGDSRLAKRAVQVAVYGRDYARALEAAELWSDLSPEDVEAHQSLAALYIRAGRLDEAVSHLEAVLGAFPADSAQGFGLLTNLLSRERNGANALEVMRRLTANREGEPEALYAYAHLASNVGENESALEALDRLLQMEPERVKALILKADVLRKIGEKDAAVATMGNVVELQPGQDDLRLSYARLLVDARKLQAAREQFRILAKSQPGNTDITYALGLLAMEAEEPDEAERHFRTLLKSEERKDEAAYALGQIAETQGDKEQAMQWYNGVGGDNFMDARLRVAQMVADESGLEAALTYLDSLELGTPELQLRRYLAEGSLLREAGQYREAMDLYSEALKAFPDNGDLLYARGMAAERIDRIDLLEADLRAILSNDPHNAQALNALGYTLADRTERYEEARQLIELAYTQAPEDPAVVDSMGWVLYRLGEHEQALEHLRRALDLQQDGEIAAHLGEVLWVTGDRQEAREVWNRALEYAPEDEVLSRTIDRFLKQ